VSFKALNKSSVQLTKYIARKHWSLSGAGLGEIKETVSPGSDSYNVLNVAFYKGMTSAGIVTGSADLDLQTTITIPTARQLPVSQSVLVYSIPADMIGSRIEPGTLEISGSFGTITDREGILMKGNNNVGDVVYTKGKVIVTDATTIAQLAGSETLKWTSNLPIYTYNADCLVKDGEFNYTLNPTLPASLLQNQDFTPYITTVGLYNKSHELIAVAKLSKPIKKASNVDMTFRVQLDI